jgi:hypothetical protein
MIQAMAKDLEELGHPTIVLGRLNETSH